MRFLIGLIIFWVIVSCTLPTENRPWNFDYIGYFHSMHK